MKITLEIPDQSKVMNVALVYGRYGQIYCASKLFDTDDLKDGAKFSLILQKEEYDEN